MSEELDLTGAAYAKSGAEKQSVMSVSALNRNVRDLLEHRIPLIWVGGEISNLSMPRSGHWYFSLKDESAQVRCVMFRNRSLGIDWQPRDGMHVEARALVTLYEARGDFQLNVEFMRQAGQGALYEAFLRLRERLTREGLFDAALKRPLPAYPRRIGIVTSLQAAALRDVLTTLARRNPAIEIVVYPAAVQGADAPAQLIAALAAANRRREVDVLILCRGGGSLEDLLAFNDEALARAIRASALPLVCGVGHETDFSIADFAADQRAPTPTAAAELVSPPRAELLGQLARHGQSLQRCFRRYLELRMQHVDHLSRRLVHPGQRLAAQRGLLGQLRQRLNNAAANLLARRRKSLEATVRALTHLDPRAVLQRGYSIVRDAQGEVIRSAAQLQPGQPLELSLARGSAQVRVEKTQED
jgi:exodeoxyribonuclease VII large subunit